MATVHEKSKAFDEIIRETFKGKTETGWIWLGQDAPINPKTLPLTNEILKEKKR